MLTTIIPDDVKISESMMDKKGILSFSVKSGSLSGVETLFNNFKDSNKTQGLIAKVDLEGLTLGKNGVYSMELKITPKK
jgi:hypothetical protein